MKGLILFWVMLFVSLAASSQLNIQQFDPLTMLPTCMSGCNVSISNVTYVGETGATGIGQIGYFSNGAVTNLGINEGIVLATGDVMGLPGQAAGFWSADMGGGGDSLLSSIAGSVTFDAAVLEFDGVPYGNQLSIQYVFGSEEYLEYVGSSYNDVFGIFITGPRPSGGTYTDYNIAIVPGTNQPVSINNVNSTSNASYYVDNEALMGQTLILDGFTVPLTATVAVIPGETYHIKVGVADAGDHLLDAVVFLTANSFSTGGEGGLSLTTHQAGYNCPGLPNGAYAWVSASGGAGSYSYLWSNQVADSIAYDLTSGTYIVSVTDILGCMSITQVVIEDIPFSIAASSTPSTCGVSDGVIQATVTEGLVAPYSFLWSHGPHESSSNPMNEQNGLAAGSYMVTVINGNGCTSSVPVYVQDNGGPAVTDSVSDATCAGGDGWISVTVDVPFAQPYTFSLTGQPDYSGNYALFSGPGQGYYELVVTDSRNCKYFNGYYIEEPPLLLSAFTYVAANNTVAFINQSPPGTYIWDFGDGTGSTETHPVHAYQNMGTYTVCLWYFNSCGYTSSCQTVQVYPASSEMMNEMSFTVYPNPARGLLYIENVTKGLPLKVLDFTGRIVSEGTTEGDVTMLDLTSLPAGMYFLSIDHRVVKFVIE